MSGTDLPAFRLAYSTLLILGAGLLLIGPGFGQATGDREKELLDQVRRREKVAAQQVEADLRQALKEAQRLVATNRSGAIDRLKNALAQLEKDTILPEARRTALQRMLKDRIRVAEADAAKPFEEKQGKLPANKRRLTDAQQPAEAKKIKQGLQKIQALQDQGKIEDASREASELARQFPESKTAFAADRAASGLDQVATARRLQKDRERNLLATSRDIDRSATPGSGDVEFPKDWKERTKGRTTAVQLTAKEKAILKALNTPITVNFRNSKLEDVIEYLKTVLDVPILLDHEAMKEVEVAYDTPITLTVKGVTARTVLRKVLADINMTYVVKDETIRATSVERAAKMMVARRYYIGDLIGNGGALAQLNGLTLNPIINQQTQGAQTIQTVNLLIDMIKSSVDSQTWKESGGDGTVTFHAPSMSLIIKQSAEVHAQLANGGLGK